MKTIIKWTGSKRYQAPCIVDKFPKTINTYFEPFLGGGSVLGELLERLEAGTYKCNNIIYFLRLGVNNEKEQSIQNN